MHTNMSRVLSPVSDKMQSMFGSYVQGSERLNLGSAFNHEPGFYSLDVSPNVGADLVHDLETVPLPIDDDRFDVILGSHVFEHIHNFVPLVKDLHRILKPGGFLISVTPYGTSDDAWDNPFHVRQFGTMTWHFFHQGLYQQKDHAGHGDFGVDYTLRVVDMRLVPYPQYVGVDDESLDKLVRTERNVIKELQVILRKETA